MHHKAFDLGAFTVEPGGRILVSADVSGEDALFRHHEQPVAKPAEAKGNDKSDAKTAAKPAAPKHAAAKHDAAAKPAEKPAASSDPKPAKPKAATKPAAKPANNS